MSDAGMIGHRGTLCGGQCRQHQDYAFGLYTRALGRDLPEGASFTLHYRRGAASPWEAIVVVDGRRYRARAERHLAAIYRTHAAMLRGEERIPARPDASQRSEGPDRWP